MGTLRVRSRHGAPRGVQGAFLPRPRRPMGLTGGTMGLARGPMGLAGGTRGLPGIWWTCAVLFLTLTWGAQASAGELLLVNIMDANVLIQLQSL